jgi:Protein of unknown function (DUF2946)
MGWVHRQKRHGVALALIALAVQIVVTFGHVHLHSGVQNAPAAITHSTVRADKNSQTPTPIPGDDEDYCALCASIFLTSTAFAPAPPQLPLPANFERVEHFSNAAAAVKPRQHLAFRSRAPPAA